MSIVRDHNEALNKAIEGTVLDLIKRVPMIGELASGIERYKNHIDKIQQQRFIDDLFSKFENLETEVRKKVLEFWNNQNNQEFVTKAVATAMNAQYTDKIDLLVNAFINGANQQIDKMEQLKFIDLVKQISVAAFEILTVIEKNPNIKGDDGKIHDSIKDEQYLNFIADETNQDKDFIRLCVSELISLGFLFNETVWDGVRSNINSTGKKFIHFIKDPPNANL